MEFIKLCVSIISKNYLSILLGVRITLFLSILGTLFGFVIGLFVGGIRSIKLDFNEPSYKKNIKKFFDAIGKIYIDIFRGTPMMIQALFFYYSLRGLFNWTPLIAALVVLSINTGAYMSEIIRSGINAINKGQIEAARSCGLSNMQTMFYIVLPQAIRNAFPAVGNELIVNIKDSSVLMVLSVTELMFETKSIAGSNYRLVETYFITAMIYLFLTGIATIILNLIEKKLLNSKTSLPQSMTSFKNIRLAKGDIHE